MRGHRVRRGREGGGVSRRRDRRYAREMDATHVGDRARIICLLWHLLTFFLVLCVASDARADVSICFFSHVPWVSSLFWNTRFFTFKAHNRFVCIDAPTTHTQKYCPNHVKHTLFFIYFFNTPHVQTSYTHFFPTTTGMQRTSTQ